ncbi:MAG TPA: hypothetical protein ENI69_07835, partial [Rhodospirillales bacterium]|nr:hypothetical protein [Rhodospirillales bacterium]
MWILRKIIHALIAPVLLLMLSYMTINGFLPLMPDVGSLTGRLVPLVPYGLAILAVIFGLIYRHERIAYAALALALGNGALVYLWPAAPVAGASWTVAYAGMALLLPGYLLYAALFSAQGIFGVQGILRLLLIAIVAQAVLMAVDGVLPSGLEAVLADLLHGRLFDKALDSGSHLPQPAMLFLAAACLILLANFIRQPGPMAAAFLGVMIATAGALDRVGEGLAPSLYVTAALAMLLAALAQEAYGMAFLDELTHLPGRRALFNDFSRLYHRALIRTYRDGFTSLLARSLRRSGALYRK